MKLINSQSIIASSPFMEKLVEIYEQNKSKLSLQQMHQQYFSQIEPRLNGKAGYMACYRFFRRYDKEQRLRVRRVLQLADDKAIDEEAVRLAIYEKSLELGELKLAEALAQPDKISTNQAMKWLFKSMEAKDRDRLITLKIKESNGSNRDALYLLSLAARSDNLKKTDLPLIEGEIIKEQTDEQQTTGEILTNKEKENKT